VAALQSARGEKMQVCISELQRSLRIFWWQGKLSNTKDFDSGALAETLDISIVRVGFYSFLCPSDSDNLPVQFDLCHSAVAPSRLSPASRASLVRAASSTAARMSNEAILKRALLFNSSR
jgi:hypothetical protein